MNLQRKASGHVSLGVKIKRAVLERGGSLVFPFFFNND